MARTRYFYMVTLENQHADKVAVKSNLGLFSNESDANKFVASIVKERSRLKTPGAKVLYDKSFTPTEDMSGNLTRDVLIEYRDSSYARICVERWGIVYGK